MVCTAQGTKTYPGQNAPLQQQGRQGSAGEQNLVHFFFFSNSITYPKT